MAVAAALMLAGGLRAQALANHASANARATTSRSLPELFTDGSFGVRPKTPLHLSGDSTIYFAGSGGFGHSSHSISWTRWNGHEAVGRGALYLNNCEPDCARGAFIPYPGTIRAFDVKPRIFVGFVGRKFVRLTISFRSAGHSQAIAYRFLEEGGFTGWQTNTTLRLP